MRADRGVARQCAAEIVVAMLVVVAQRRQPPGLASQQRAGWRCSNVPASIDMARLFLLASERPLATEISKGAVGTRLRSVH